MNFCEAHLTTFQLNGGNALHLTPAMLAVSLI